MSGIPVETKWYLHAWYVPYCYVYLLLAQIEQGYMVALSILEDWEGGIWLGRWVEYSYQFLWFLRGCAVLYVAVRNQHLIRTTTPIALQILVRIWPTWWSRRPCTLISSPQTNCSSGLWDWEILGLSLYGTLLHASWLSIPSVDRGI